MAVITSATKIHTDNINHKSDEPDISKHIPLFDNGHNETFNKEIHNEKNSGNLKQIVRDDALTNQLNNCHSHECETFDTLSNNTCLGDQIDVNIIVSKDNNVKAKDEHFNRNYGNNNDEKVLPRRFLNFVDSDSEEESNLYETLNKESFVLDNDCHLESGNTKGIRRIIDSDSEDETTAQTDNANDPHRRINKIIFNRALIDSESEEEEEDKRIHNSLIKFDNVAADNKNVKQASISKRKGSIRASKDEAMRQIHSETQRLLRETEISLPYHRPKQRTLREFLNRKKLSTVLPKAPSTAAKLKMSSTIVSQALAEKEKEAELFYKSSDSENEQTTSSPCDNEKKKVSSIIGEKSLSADIEYICIEDTQTIGKNIQDFHNKREIIQQGHLDLGVPRVLFGKNDCEDNHQNRELSFLNIENSCNSDEKDDKTKKYKQENLESTPQKLFDSMNEIFVMNRYQEQMKSTVKSIIASLNGENCIDDKNESEVCMITGHSSSKIDSESSNGDMKQDLIIVPTIKNTSKVSYVCNEQNEIDHRTDMQTENNMKKSFFSSINDDESKSQNSLLIEKSDNGTFDFAVSKFKDKTLINKNKLLPNVSNSKITLKGSPGMIIDLTADERSNGKGVNGLLDRFFCKHVVNVNIQSDSTSEVAVIRVQDTQNGLIPIKEIFPYKLPINNIENPELNKPGAKLTRLKEDLKLQMALKRDKEWKHKKMETQEGEEDNDEEESDCDLNDKEETDYSGSSDGESEPEEDDISIKDKKRKKCFFADDEAEVTDNENSNESTEDTYTDTDELGYNEKQSIICFKHKSRTEHTADDNISEIEQDNIDANVDNTSEIDFKDDDNIYENRRILEKQNNYFTTDVDISEDENHVFQQQEVDLATRSQICETPSVKTSMLDFVSPITQLSILNTNLNFKDSKEESSLDKDESIKDTQNDGYTLESACKLFDDIKESMDDEYLKQLCSGKFGPRSDLNDFISQSSISESQLVELCSGNFNTKLVDTKQLKNSEMKDETSQDIKLLLNEDSNSFVNYTKKMKRVNTVNAKLKLRVASSDDENESDETFLKTKRRPAKRLNLSDSEDEKEEDKIQFSDEENDDNEETNQYVDYDSEENEVIVVPEKDIKKVAAGFLEQEAELSESDWESADEDEKDMDKLEFEEADDEHIDTEEVKDELGKIHMRQILDEDKREVRLLKELLFEDGDLHTEGNGRERKFKWRNIDKLGNNISETGEISEENDGWVDVQEDEEEARWSKLRHERDKFLEERKNTANEIEDELCDSQVFKFGLEAVKKIKSNESRRQNTCLDIMDSTLENIEPIMPRNITDLLNGPNTGKKSQTIYNVFKKRSLLSRGEESLSRIASLAKQGEPVSHALNTKNFVFQYIDVCTDDTSKVEDKMREEKNVQSKPRKRKMRSELKMAIEKKRKEK